MLALPSAVRIYLAVGAVDLRKSIDGLCALVSERQHDLYSGHLYVFVSRRGDRLKILTWSTGGFLLRYKRLERGRSGCRSAAMARPRWSSTRPSSRCCSTGSTSSRFSRLVGGRRRPAKK